MFNKLLFILFYIIFFGFSLSFKEIDLNDYKGLRDILLKNKNKLKYNDNTSFFMSYLCKQKCNYFESSNNIFYFTPSCFSNFCEGSFNRNFLEFRDSVDTAWDLIIGFDKIYDLNSTKFYYSSAKPKFYVNYNLDDFIGHTKIDDLLLGVLQIYGYYIKIPKIFLAYENLKSYSFYVSDKNLGKRNKSRLYNFNIAMGKLDKYFLEPGKELNFNKLIAYLPGYKKKYPKSNYAFYGGVCGVSTMLFRNALISPYLYVTKRYNHSQWYVYFYSDYIYGDDASVYEFIKIFKVKNISNYPIYFRRKQIGDKLYFVSIVPNKSDNFVIVEKKQTGKLSAYVKTSVYDKNGFLKYYQDWFSNYIKKNYER